MSVGGLKGTIRCPAVPGTLQGKVGKGFKAAGDIRGQRPRKGWEGRGSEGGKNKAGYFSGPYRKI